VQASDQQLAGSQQFFEEASSAASRWWTTSCVGSSPDLTWTATSASVAFPECAAICPPGQPAWPTGRPTTTVTTGASALGITAAAIAT